MSSFSTWWVEQRGRPPVAGEADLFELCRAVWDSRRNVEDLDDPEHLALARKAWRDAPELNVQLRPTSGQWPAPSSDPEFGPVRRFQRDYHDAAVATQCLELSVRLIHTPASVELVAGSEAALHTVSDAAERAALWVRSRAESISPERLCSLVFSSQTSLVEEKDAS